MAFGDERPGEEQIHLGFEELRKLEKEEKKKKKKKAVYKKKKAKKKRTKPIVQPKRSPRRRAPKTSAASTRDPVSSNSLQTAPNSAPKTRRSRPQAPGARDQRRRNIRRPVHKRTGQPPRIRTTRSRIQRQSGDDRRHRSHGSKNVLRAIRKMPKPQSRAKQSNTKPSPMGSWTASHLCSRMLSSLHSSRRSRPRRAAQRLPVKPSGRAPRRNRHHHRRWSIRCAV